MLHCAEVHVVPLRGELGNPGTAIVVDRCFRTCSACRATGTEQLPQPLVNWQLQLEGLRRFEQAVEVASVECDRMFDVVRPVGHAEAKGANAVLPREGQIVDGSAAVWIEDPIDHPLAPSVRSGVLEHWRQRKTGRRDILAKSQWQIRRKGKAVSQIEIARGVGKQTLAASHQVEATAQHRCQLFGEIQPNEEMVGHGLFHVTFLLLPER